MSMDELIAAARVNKAWPFLEAQRLLKRYPDGAKPALAHFGRFDRKLGQSHRANSRLDLRSAGTQIHERTQRHVAADPAEAIKVG